MSLKSKLYIINTLQISHTANISGHFTIKTINYSSYLKLKIKDEGNEFLPQSREYFSPMS